MLKKPTLLVVSLLAGPGTFARQAPPAPPAAPPTGAARTSGQAESELSEHIWCVFQAKDSAYWFGSNGQGVYRWDGKAIRRFTTEHGLAAGAVRGIQEDRSGSLFVVTEGGVRRFDGRGFSTPPVAETSEWKLQADDLWFPAGTDTGSVYRWDGTSLHRLIFPKTAAGDAHEAAAPRSQFPNAKYSPYDVYTIFKDSKARLWFGTAVLGACRYDGSSFVWVGHGENGSFGVRSIVEDKDGKFWLGNCVSRFAQDPAADPVRYLREPGIATAADPHSAFVSSLRDKDGVLWVATLGGGVFRYDGTTWTHFPVTHEGKPIWVFQLYRDRQERLWLGTQDHGVYRFDGKGFERVKL